MKIFKSIWVWLALAAAVVVGLFKRPKREDLRYYEEILRQKQMGEKQAVRDEAARRRRLIGVDPGSERAELLRRIRARRRANDGDSTR